MQLAGSMVALVTPMDADGLIDKFALATLIEWHITENTSALVIAGTTGESATLCDEEHADLIATVVKQVKQRIPVIAGTGANSTHKTLKLTQQAKAAGADACLVVTPYYNKPPQMGLYAHYRLVAEKTMLPMILYNVPTRTACDLLPETVEQLAQINYIVGIKEATGNKQRALEIAQRCGRDFAIYSGDDATALALMQLGARGVISVTANVAPAKMQAMCTAALAGDITLATQLNTELAGLHQDLFIETNPIPTKWALQQMQKIKSGIRLPLISLNKQYHERVKQAMQQAGISL